MNGSRSLQCAPEIWSESVHPVKSFSFGENWRSERRCQKCCFWSLDFESLVLHRVLTVSGVNFRTQGSICWLSTLKISARLLNQVWRTRRFSSSDQVLQNCFIASPGYQQINRHCPSTFLRALRFPKHIQQQKLKQKVAPVSVQFVTTGGVENFFRPKWLNFGLLVALGQYISNISFVWEVILGNCSNRALTSDRFCTSWQVAQMSIRWKGYPAENCDRHGPMDACHCKNLVRSAKSRNIERG